MHSRRIAATFFIFMALVAGLSARLLSVSVYRHADYVALADQQQYVENDVLPRRGSIYAQDAASGKTTLLAQSAEEYALSVDPANVQFKDEYGQVLAKYGTVDATQLIDKIKAAPGHYLPVIRHGLTQQEVNDMARDLNAVERAHDAAHIDVKVNFDAAQGDVIYFIGGVFLTREYQRVYPEGSFLAQVMGFVDDSGNGKYGFEEHYNAQLRGYAGKLLSERDSQGNLLQQQEAVAGSDGTTYELSIDRNVQAVVEQDLADEVKKDEATGGSVVVVNPKNGEIIAMASVPSYDPNNLRNMSSADVGLFDNPAISYNWEPGSIFKPLVMAAALDTGAVTRDTSNDFPESVMVNGYKIETALRHAYGHENMAQVLDNSDNVAMVWVSDKLGNQTMHDYLKSFGMGSATGIDLANEATGVLKQAKSWSDIDRATMSFGQGISVTPIQIVTAYTAIANGGKIVEPHIVHATVNAAGKRTLVQPVYGNQVVKPETAKTLLSMMVETVATAHAKAGTPGYDIGGKTGTAQIPDPVNGGYLKDAYNHSFVGIGPAGDPQYVALVKVDHPNIAKVGTYAESTAVPLFGKISTFLLNYYQIPPTKK